MNTILTIPQGDKLWLTANASTNQHWRFRHRTASAWRSAAADVARLDMVQPFRGPVRITGTVHKADKRIWDVDGAVATLKAAIDGLRDAGVLAGDDHRFVKAITSEWGEPDPDAPRLVLTIVEVA